MSTNSLQSLHYHHHHHSFLRHHHHSDAGPSSSSSSSLKPTTNPNPLSLLLSTTSNTTNTLTPFSLSPSTSPSSLTSTTTTISTSPLISFNLLQQHLQSQNFRLADEETRRLLISLAGEAAEKRGYVFFSEVKFIAEADLKAIDELWRQYSDNKFGYSVQKRIWEKGNKDFTNFFIKVGWMKKLASSEVEQYNYRAFPDEFVWENGEETPVGHLPLTNALRGTQLLCCILSHPAFECMQDDDDDDDDDDEVIKVPNEGKGSDDDDDGVLKTNNKPLSKRVFKTDYSF